MKQPSIQMIADIIPEPGRSLRAGELTLIYDRGNIRHIKDQRIELVNMFYGAVRLNDWSTPSPVISEETITEYKDSFHIRYRAAYYHPVDGHQLYQGEFIMEGRSDSTVSFTMNGVVVAAFKSNRVGICVLHPVKELAGRTVRVQFSDGSVIYSSFPGKIAPHQPFGSFRQLQWNLPPDRLVTLQFEGAVFETEDQRNWSDYSFKTYSGPLADPWPVQLNPGDILHQSIVLKLQRGIAKEEPGAMLLNTEGAAAEEWTMTTQKRTQTAGSSETGFLFPLIGFGLPADLSMFKGPAAYSLQHIHFDLLRLPLQISDSTWHERLFQAARIAEDLKVSLELVIVLNNEGDSDLTPVVDSIKIVAASVYSIITVSSKMSILSAAVFASYHQQLRTGLPGIRIGYGTGKHFADLNRNPPPEQAVDFLQFGLSPQVHAFDTLSIIENLPALTQMVSDAADLGNGVPVHISPLCFDSEFTATGKDERNNSSMQACWFLQAIGKLTGAAVISLFDLDADESFMTLPNPSDSPLFDVLKRVKQFRPAYIRHTAEEDNTLSLENSTGETLEILFPSVYNPSL